MGLRDVVNGLKSLITLLTTIPVGTHSIEYAAQYFYLIPIVGLIEGAIVSLLTWIPYMLRIEVVLISALYPFFHLLITGGIHIDGYADYSDVLGSHRVGEYAIMILKDPKRGVFAIVSVTINLIASTASMYLLLVKNYLKFPLWLVLIYVASTESMYITSFFGIEEPYEGLGKRFVLSAKISNNLVKNIAVLLMIYLPTVLLAPTEIHIVSTTALAAAIVSIIVAIDARKRLGFVSGDVMGFSYELTRVVCMVITACI